MPLFTNKNKSLTAIEQLSFKTEKEIQTIVEANLETIFGLKLISSEFPVGEFRLDSLAFDEDSNSFVIIEYKKGSSYSIVDQGYSYLATMLNNKAEFVLKYNEETRQQLNKNSINWKSSRVIFISPSFNAYQKNSINFADIPFELWEISKYKGGIVGIEQYQASSNESIKQITKTSNNSTIKRVSSEVKVLTEQDHVDNTSKSIKLVWEELKSRLEKNYPETSFPVRPNYISWTRDNKVICYIRFHKKNLKIEVIRGNIRSNGQKSRGFFTMKGDPKKLAKEISLDKRTSTKKEYAIPLNKTEDINYVIFLLEQKYNSMG